MADYLLPPRLFPQTPVVRKVFVSYHHENDQQFADWLRGYYGETNTFIDRSLPEEIDSDDNDYILGEIRTRHLRTSTVTIVLIGSETWARKWVDWELYSSLRPYRGRTVNGLLGILLPGATRLPPRFEANFNAVRTPFGWNQNGYARLISWEAIYPSTLSPNPKSNIIENLSKRKFLKDVIEDAYVRRTMHPIHNEAPRFKRNRS